MAVVGYRKQIGVSSPFIYTQNTFECRFTDDEFQGLQIVEASANPFPGGVARCTSDETGATFPAGIINCGTPGVAPGTYRGVYCSNVDRNYCPTFASPPFNARFARKALGDPFDGPWVRCQYSTQDFTDASDIETWIDVFGRTDAWYNQIMPAFCSRNSASCPNNPIGDTTTDACPMIRSVGPGGDLCRQWETEMLRRGGNSSTIYYNTVNALCSTDVGGGYFSCDCMNRNNDPDFVTLQNLLAQTISIPNPYCYYIPCSSSQYYVIPKDINDLVQNATDKGISPCPTDFCLSITRIVANGNVNFTPQGETNISCNFPGSTNAQKISLFTSPAGVTSVLDVSDTSTVLVWLVIALLLIILLIAAYYFIFA